MKHFLKISADIPVGNLKRQIAAQPELWNANAQRLREGAPFKGTDDIWVRYNDPSRMGPNFNDEHVPVWYPAWEALPGLRPIVFGLMTHVQGEMLGGVLITRIPPGAEIKPHIDAGWHVDYYDKFYIAIENEPGANFWCRHDDVTESLSPEPGSCWLFDNRKLHWVTNESGCNRVTLIICIRTALFGREDRDRKFRSLGPQALQQLAE